MTTVTRSTDLEVPYTLAFHPELRPADIRVFLALAHFERGGLDRPTHAGIAELVGMGVNMVGPALRRLEGVGAISIDTTAIPHAVRIVP